MALDPALLALLSERNLGVLATVRRNGRPQLTNVNYHFDPDRLLIRVSLTADRAKVKNLRRDPRATFLVSSDDGWSYTVADTDAELTEVTTDPDDDAMRELIDVYRAVAGKEHPDWDDYRRAMIEDQRLVAKLTVTHVYGQAR